MKFRIIIGPLSSWPYQIEYKERNSIFCRWKYIDMLATLQAAETQLNNFILNGWKPSVKLPALSRGKIMKTVSEADMIVIKLQGSDDGKI